MAFVVARYSGGQQFVLQFKSPQLDARRVASASDFPNHQRP